jgi:hypothetical protein
VAQQAAPAGASKSDAVSWARYSEGSAESADGKAPVRRADAQLEFRIPRNPLRD